MRNKIRISCVILSIALMLSVFVGCSGKNTAQKVPFDSKSNDSIASGKVAANENYELIWEDDAKCVMIKNISTGKIWSTIPYNYYLEGGMSANVNSTLNLTVSNTQTLQWDTVNGFTEAFTDGRITSAKIENGIKVTYYFDKYKISVPVVYTLNKNSLELSIDPGEISEGKDYVLVSLSPAPFLCAAENSQENSYLLIPTGSGALMYTDERAEGDRSYSGDIYGVDGSRLLTDNPMSEEAIRIPLYGVKDGDDALVAIIEEGAESAKINALAGNKRTGYSNVCADFYVRGYDKVSSGIQSLNYEDLIKVSDEFSLNPIKISYFPLVGDSADYVGMAECYKKYITDNGMLKEYKSDEATYGVTILGGVLKYDTSFGLPSKSLSVMTTFKEAQKISERLNGLSGMKPEIMLSGFGENGINAGTVAGGFNFPKSFGSSNDRISFENYCKDNGINLFTDFEIISFNSSGKGFSTVMDTAKSASLQAVKHNLVEIPLRNDNRLMKYNLLKREKLETAVKKLIKSVDKLSVSGVGVSTLGRMAYSDYSNERYYSKGNMASDVIKYINQIKKADHKVAVSKANSYAAAVGNSVFESPVDNGEYFVFDVNIPFYQMIFTGTKPIYSKAVNIAGDFNKQIMLSLIGGSRLSFTLVNKCDASDLEIQSQRVYAAVFEDNLKLIEDTLKKYEPFYKAINGSGIKDYRLINNDISETVFENGVRLYANHSATEADSPVGRLSAYEVQMIEE